MAMRFAILAACANMLVLTQAGGAQAGYSAAPPSRGAVSTSAAGLERATVLAQSVISTTRSNIKRPTKAAEANSALGQVSTTRGRKLPLVGSVGERKPAARLIGPALGDVNGDGRRNRPSGGTLPKLR
jgi:hypothetical protein